MKTNVQLSPESEHASFLHTSVLFFYGQLQEISRILSHKSICVWVFVGE